MHDTSDGMKLVSGHCRLRGFGRSGTGLCLVGLLLATVALLAAPEPLRCSIAQQEGDVVIAWPTEAGKTYAVLRSGLLHGNWEVVFVRTAPGRTLTTALPIEGATAFFRIQEPPPEPPGMVLIPAGSFQMGDSSGEGASYEPVHTVYVSAFYMDRTEVTKALWDEVYQWAIGHGYGFDYPGAGKAPEHPVHTVNWYDVVRWCNARSEKAGCVPAYYTSAAQTTVYRTGRVVLQNDWVRWNAGYRLPTEAEWEKAAWGGASGRRFPWSDTDMITHSQANYYSSSSYSYDVSPTRQYHPAFTLGGWPYTSPVGYFAPNGYGLYDMAGNVWEWCWDKYAMGYYGYPTRSDPRGPPGHNSYRLARGGSFNDEARRCQVAFRWSFYPPNGFSHLGFRSVLPRGQP
ncbi:MAG: formylglycine-generating enzyme family protein [Verrucomicrobia bacterium]|nr:formylglycine-generating enzyme family protein [Verrucomicrobiota bacterium]